MNQQTTHHLVTKAEYALMRGCSRAYLSKKPMLARLLPAMEQDAQGRHLINVDIANEILSRAPAPPLPKSHDQEIMKILERMKAALSNQLSDALAEQAAFTRRLSARVTARLDEIDQLIADAKNLIPSTPNEQRELLP